MRAGYEHTLEAHAPAKFDRGVLMQRSTDKLPFVLSLLNRARVRCRSVFVLRQALTLRPNGIV